MNVEHRIVECRMSNEKQRSTTGAKGRRQRSEVRERRTAGQSLRACLVYLIGLASSDL